MLDPANTELACDFLRQVFGPVTGDPVFVCSLPNDRNDEREPGERRLMSRDMDEIGAHLTRWDRAARAFFFCVATLRPDAKSDRPGGSPRSKANVSELTLLWADIDFKDQELDETEILARIRTLPCPPSIIVRSGNGLHLYWLLSEALDLPHDDVEAILRQLADLVAGDLAVADVARLMRLPGSHNTKRGAWTPVEIIQADYERRHHLPQIEDMVSICGPVIRRKETASVQSRSSDNPFLAVAARFGFKPPIDVEQRLASMSFGAGSDASVHATQLAVTASLLTRGTPLEDVVGIVLDATRAAAGAYGERWNWRREERAVRSMCETWLRKNPNVRPLPARQVEERANGTTGQAGAVVPIEAARARKADTQRKTATTDDLPIMVADGVIEAVRAAGQDLLLTEGEVFIYAAGIWSVMTPADQQWLQTLVQEGVETLGKSAKATALNAAWKRLMEHPALFRRTVEWDALNLIATPNGMLHPVDGSFVAHDPSFYARRKIGAVFTPGATCPRFHRFLDSLFADRTSDDRTSFMATIQAFMGAALAVGLLSREERKALILVGPSRTGKTELSRVIRLLVGNPVATPSVAEISERFGLSSLYGAAAWIRDDAINEGDDLDPQRFKTIVTGEPIDIERKHMHPVRGHEFNIPILLTTNALPRTRDKSDAIFNRSLILEMTNVIEEDVATSIKTAMGVPRGMSIGAHIFAEEGPGILNWAIDGLRRLTGRGSYELPEAIRTSIQRFKDDNNPVGEWARACTIRRPGGRVARHDLVCA